MRCAVITQWRFAGIHDGIAHSIEPPVIIANGQIVPYRPLRRSTRRERDTNENIRHEGIAVGLPLVKSG